MCAHVQNLESLSVMSAETGVTSISTGLISLSGAQIGVTGRPTDLTGPFVSDNNDFVPRLENSDFDDLKYDKVDVVDWWKPIIDYLEDPS
jgi:hypothetical protein